MVFKYDEDEWATLVPPDPGWTREETDYLLDVCALYQLRFLVIADRYHVRFLSLAKPVERQLMSSLPDAFHSSSLVCDMVSAAGSACA